ncbi:hypothetical protein E8E13_003042 [Curvularia kusanoi]|uniref:NADAR domain-containing protein n=1 Tax=Curvularia kusanoi TaxID=90978 RepID=A0A9P4T9Z4_CURKU|nr:hypothetical protein E8E13_003042 [Curvularia kusanoi]
MTNKQDQDFIEVVAIEKEAAPRDRVCFYGGAHYLSNMYIAEFTDGDTTYNCVEQYFQTAKAALFKDTATQSLIMSTKAPIKQKQLGKKVKPFDKAEWAKEAYAVVLRGLRLKFITSAQAADLGAQLLSTGSSELVEASPRDVVWGVGLGRERAKTHVGPWRGKNLLGKALMEVRRELEEEVAATEQKSHLKRKAVDDIATSETEKTVKCHRKVVV